jgi:predicted unusual protein kinase regulating ubiquinone biosynthesis (AarF/ABC1/UbiB family)
VDEEKNTLTGRVKRYFDVSTTMSGTVAKLLSEHFFGMSLDHGAQAQNLTLALGKLKGPIMKVAQLLATVPDAIPPEYAMEFLSLQADAPAMGWPFVRRRMQMELGPDWQSKFKSFEQAARAAASLGQVHQAVSLDDRLLACKLQYPDMTSTVEADLRQLKLIFKVYESTIGAIDTQDIFQEVADRLREELDYELEAKHMSRYRNIFKGFDFINIPEVIPELSTKRLLTMTWLEGKRLKDVIDEPQEFRNLIARNMFYSWYYPFYHHGVIHGDPHLGNYTFNQDASVNLLDFGCMREFKPNLVQGVLDLYKAMETNNRDLAVKAYETWGFENLTNEIIDVLNLWAKLLCEPILDDRVRPIQEGNSGVYGRELADKVHHELRRLGGVKPPREFVFMDRATVGIGSVCMHLRAELNWHQLFLEVIR